MHRCLLCRRGVAVERPFPPNREEMRRTQLTEAGHAFLPRSIAAFLSAGLAPAALAPLRLAHYDSAPTGIEPYMATAQIRTSSQCRLRPSDADAPGIFIQVKDMDLCVEFKPEALALTRKQYPRTSCRARCAALSVQFGGFTWSGRPTMTDIDRLLQSIGKRCFRNCYETAVRRGENFDAQDLLRCDPELKDTAPGGQRIGVNCIKRLVREGLAAKAKSMCVQGGSAHVPQRCPLDPRCSLRCGQRH